MAYSKKQGTVHICNSKTMNDNEFNTLQQHGAKVSDDEKEMFNKFIASNNYTVINPNTPKQYFIVYERNNVNLRLQRLENKRAYGPSKADILNDYIKRIIGDESKKMYALNYNFFRKLKSTYLWDMGTTLPTDHRRREIALQFSHTLFTDLNEYYLDKNKTTDTLTKSEIIKKLEEFKIPFNKSDSVNELKKVYMNFLISNDEALNDEVELEQDIEIIKKN